MLDRQHGKIIFECEDCTETLEADTGDFSKAMELFRQEGWRATNVDGGWCHYCPEHTDK